MDFLELARRRCSIRSYRDTPIESEKMEAILDAARVAPTACNRQPLHLIVVRSVEARTKLDKAARLFGAPTVVIVCADRDTVWTRKADGMQTTDIDAAIVTDHMMLEATALGIGSVWVCAFDPKIIREEFSLPSNLEPINLLALGYPGEEGKDPHRHDTERKQIADFVSFDTL